MKKVAGVVNYVRHQANQLYQSPTRTLEVLEVFWDFSRRYFYALAFWSLICTKLLHLFAHLYSLPLRKFIIWGPSFFFQDVAILLLFRILVQKTSGYIAVTCALIVLPFSIIVSGMAAANFSVYVFTGAEIHWRQAKTFTGDAAALRTLLSGLTGFLIGEALLVAAALFTARPIHQFGGGVLHVLAWPFRSLLTRLRPCVGFVEPLLKRLQNQRTPHTSLPDPRLYEEFDLEDDYLNESGDEDEEDDFLLDSHGSNASSNASKNQRSTDRLIPRVLVLGFVFLAATLRTVRPSEPVYLYLSGTLPFASFFEGGHRNSPVDISGLPPYQQNYLAHKKSVNLPPSWEWMPKDALPGFEDWKLKLNVNESLHYDPKTNPLHISNLQKPILESIQGVLADGSVKIKHVVLLKLESARADTFPVRKDSFLYNRIAETYDDNEIPQEVEDRIANLTRTAEFLTGFPSGFQRNDTLHADRNAYGGISARNAYTTSTYTLKSLVGTLCGVSPLVADFNREWEHHIYQPCLPHIFEMLNSQQGITSNVTDFTQWPWHSIWMQSVTEGYDNQDQLTPVLGFKDKFTKETIESPDAKHYPVKTEEVNYYGYADTELREYISDAIDDAERDHRRLFLSHLTGTTHHPWGLPNSTYEQILGLNKGHNKDLNHYLNAVGFQDKWLTEIIGILEEKGVANETLFVMAGDHGLSLPNDGGITPYDNPHVGSFAVPIVLAHPQLPALEITAPVSSDQIVPTILDLLIESHSLPKDSTKPAKDILSLYEGQSLIRPLIQEQDGIQDWQYTVMNTGGSWLAVRSAARPQYRLVIPLVNDVEWRFSDLSTDPHELEPISRFDLVDLAAVINKEYDEDVVKWLFDAAYVTNWWVGENWARYRFHPTNGADE
ncbi:alkaline-phosphatase-like protein [Penicillium verhagenii]|nr:alkaline-phosphatase-like protein [Penicillium verhagenii]